MEVPEVEPRMEQASAAVKAEASDVSSKFTFKKQEKIGEPS